MQLPRMTTRRWMIVVTIINAHGLADRTVRRALKLVLSAGKAIGMSGH